MTRPSAGDWHIITCEYPPTIGGVSDYARTIASALSGTATTHVWAPGASGDTNEEGVHVHRVLGGFGWGDLRRAGRAMDACPAPRRLIVQWVPQGFGFRSVNVLFAWWLLMRTWRHGDELQVMVHEPFVMFEGRPGQFAAALLHRLMFVLACLGAARVWTSTPTWVARVTPYVRRRTRPQWLPVPAPPLADDDRVPVRTATTPRVGHFGTHSPLVTTLLASALDIILERSPANVVLIGRDSDRFLADYVRTRPGAATRLEATGAAEPATLANRIAGCDVLLQPYPDGVSARRTSTLTLMKRGCAVVTNLGHLSEAFWREEGGLELVDRPDTASLGRAVIGLLADKARREDLGQRAQDVYDRCFDVRHSVALLSTCPANESDLRRA